jgi:hypothetical protein
MNCLQQRFAIQWYLAHPCIISGQDARTTRNFGIFFKFLPVLVLLAGKMPALQEILGYFLNWKSLTRNKNPPR